MFKKIFSLITISLILFSCVGSNSAYSDVIFGQLGYHGYYGFVNYFDEWTYDQWDISNGKKINSAGWMTHGQRKTLSPKHPNQILYQYRVWTNSAGILWWKDVKAKLWIHGYQGGELRIGPDCSDSTVEPVLLKAWLNDNVVYHAQMDDDGDAHLYL